MRRHVNRGWHGDAARSKPSRAGPGDPQATNDKRDHSQAVAAPPFRQRVDGLRLCVDSYLGLCYGAFDLS
jgi:hypothetical protein